MERKNLSESNASRRISKNPHESRTDGGSSEISNRTERAEFLAAFHGPQNRKESQKNPLTTA